MPVIVCVTYVDDFSKMAFDQLDTTQVSIRAYINVFAYRFQAGIECSREIENGGGGEHGDRTCWVVV